MDFANIIKNGKHYFPAYEHYGHITNVVCDRCNKDNLPECVGYQNKDLCMACVDQLKGIKKEDLTFMGQDMFKTLMGQDMFRR